MFSAALDQGSDGPSIQLIEKTIVGLAVRKDHEVIETKVIQASKNTAEIVLRSCSFVRG
jgi:hypothetical protein